MKTMKKTFLRIFFSVEIVVFLCINLFGPHGIKAFIQMHEKNIKIKQETVQLKGMIATLDQDISAWHDNSFYKEKIAREALQMARRDEQVYYVS